MDNSIWIPILTLVSGVLGVLVAWLALSHQKKKDTEKEGENRGSLASDIGYIKAGVDDLKRESRETIHDVSELKTRVTRCEESCKQAHKRLDEMHEHMESR